MPPPDLDTSRSVAILLGASEFPRNPQWDPRESFRRTAEAVRDYWISDTGLKIPESNILNLFNDPRDPGSQLDDIEEFLVSTTSGLSACASENLFLFYVGHGCFANDQKHCFALRCTKADSYGRSAIRGHELALVLQTHASCLRSFIVLDCCFAAQLYSEFQAAPGDALHLQFEEDLPSAGTALLCASSKQDVGKARADWDFTMFGTVLLRCLRTGHPSLHALMSLRDVESLCRVYMRQEFPGDFVRPELHVPLVTKGDIATIPLFPNFSSRDNQEVPNQDLFHVTLVSRGDDEEATLRAIRRVTKLGLKSAWSLLKSVPTTLIEQVSPSLVSDILHEFEGIATLKVEEISEHRQQKLDAVDYLNQSLQEIYDLLERGENAQARGDFDVARQCFQKAAEEHGNSDASYLLGRLYADDLHDFDQALLWLHRAGEIATPAAYNRIGLLYKEGSGTPRDLQKAHTYFRRAADEGCEYGMSNLANMYLEGEGTEQDLAAARHWYEMSLAAGNESAASTLGRLHVEGLGVPQDLGKAFEYYRIPAEAGDPAAITWLGALYYRGVGVTQDFALAMSWFLKAADKGEAEAMWCIAALYEHGHGVALDEKEAFSWLQKAAWAGLTKAMTQVGNYYRRGTGIMQDLEQAKFWLEKAVARGDGDALLYIGALSFDQKDFSKAAVYYDRAVALRVPRATFCRGWMHESGEGFEIDYMKARALYLEAAAENVSHAMLNLGVMYRDAKGVPRDLSVAREWFERAEAAGHKEAAKYLATL